ncbi:MAG: sigma-70 family RNA polymerase sigma factor [Myxococcota bacterium]
MSPSSSISEPELFRAWLSGDRKAGALLFAQHFDIIVQFFSRRVGRDAEDLAQRTFLACEESRARIRGTCSFRTFVFSVAHHVLGKHFRSKHRRDDRTEQGVDVLRDPSPSSSAVMAVVEDHEHLDEALEQLDREHRRVLELFYWEQRTSAEVARELGVPHGTARTRIRRARTLLREQIERSEGSMARGRYSTAA